jgi:DNA-binding transcriptional LysR family regulator
MQDLHHTNMEFRALRSFTILADHLHFAKAAANLHLSQSALSVQIRNLEQDLKVELFIRNRRSVMLTPAGSVLLQDARRLLRDSALARSNVQRAARGQLGRLRIAFVSTAATEFIPSVVRTFKDNYPDVELTMRNLTTSHQVDAFRREEIDVGLVRLPLSTDQLWITPLHKEPFICFLPKNHALAKKARIHPSALSRELFVMYARAQAPGFYDRILRICNDSGFSPTSYQEAGEMQTILSMVASGLGVAILPRSASALGVTQLALRPLVGNWPPSELGLAAPTAMLRNPLFATFKRVVDGVFSSNLR